MKYKAYSHREVAFVVDMDTPDLNQLTNLTAQQKLGGQGLLAGQNQLTADYLKRYTDFLSGQEGASAMAGRIGQELGIPTLQANANLLRNTLTNLPQTYSKATTGYDVNANQLSRIIGQKAGELAPAVETTERALSSAQNTLGQRMGYETADQTRQEKPYAMERELMSERMARETTLFTQESENELSALIAKIQAGVQLTTAEIERATALAAMEKNYQIEKEKMASSERIAALQYDYSTGWS